MTTNGSHLKYARALYRVATGSGVEERVLEDLEDLSSLLKSRSFAELINKIMYMEGTKLSQLLTSVFKGKIQKVTLNCLIVLALSKKLGIVPRVAVAYRQMYHSEKNIPDLLIRSARKLDKEEESKLKDGLQKKYGKPVAVRFEESSELIGGMQIYENGTVTDYSMQNYLSTLRQHLMKELIVKS